MGSKEQLPIILVTGLLLGYVVELSVQHMSSRACTSDLCNCELLCSQNTGDIDS